MSDIARLSQSSCSTGGSSAKSDGQHGNRFEDWRRSPHVFFQQSLLLCCSGCKVGTLSDELLFVVGVVSFARCRNTRNLVERCPWENHTFVGGLLSK